MNIHPNKNSTPFKKTFVFLALVLAALIGYAVYAYISHAWPFKNTTTTQKEDDTGSINYNPPTSQEVAGGQDAKKRGEEPTEEKPSEPGKKIPVNVGLAFADIYQGKLEIRAFTSNVIEGTGTCTATVTMKNMPSMKVTKQSEAFIDASSTQCRPIYIPASELDSGVWLLNVTFSSPDHEGVSETKEVTVP